MIFGEQVTRFGDRFVGCEALEVLEPTAEDMGGEEVAEMPSELIVRVVVVAWRLLTDKYDGRAKALVEANLAEKRNSGGRRGFSSRSGPSWNPADIVAVVSAGPLELPSALSAPVSE